MILNGGKMFKVRALQRAEHQQMARVLWQSQQWLIDKQLSQGEIKPNPFSHTDERQNNFTHCHW